jgi:hypothetical protein
MTTTLILAYLGENRHECSEEVEVEDENIQELATKGRGIVIGHGEFTSTEIDGMEETDLARLALSSERGADAYSLACASYLYR